MSSASSPNIGIGITLGGAPTVVAGLQQVQAKMGDLARETLSTQTALGVLAAAGLTLTAGAFVSMLKGTIETQAALNDLAIQTGASAEALSALAAIGKTTNTSAGDIATAMGRLAKNMAGADEESRGAAQGLIAIGLSVKDFKALKPEEQMQALAAQLAHYQDGSGKAAVAMALLGKEGARLLPYMADLALVGTLQAKVTNEQVAAADNLSDNLVRIKASSEGWKKELAQGMVPALDVAAQAWLDNINGAGGLREEIKALSKDGTITEWTYNAITALTYLMDVGGGVKNTVLLIGEAYGLTAALIVEKISGLNAMMEHARKGDLAGFDAERAASKARQEAMKKDFDGRLQAMLEVESLGAKMRAKIADLRNTPAATVAQRDELKFDPAAAAAKTTKDTEAQDLAKLLAEQAGLNGDFAKKWDLLSAAYARGTLNLAQLTEQQGVLLSKQPAMVAAKKAEIDAAKSANDAFDDYFAAQEKARLANESQIKSAREMLDSIQFETQLIGLSNTERAIAIASRDLERQGIIAGTQAYDAYIERIRTALTGKEAALANADAARQIAADWKRTAEQINASITDALMRGFESGKGFAANLRDTIANMFKTLVLRPVVQAVVGSTLGSVGSAATAANAASSMGSAGSSLGSLSSLYSAGSSLLSGGSSIMGAATNAAGTVGQNLGLSYYNGTGWSATGMGDALMTAGPYAAAALVALNALGVFRKTKQVGAGITGTLGADTELQDYKQLRKSGTLFRGPSYWKEFSDTAEATETALEASAASVIRTTTAMAQALGLNAEKVAGYTEKIDVADAAGLQAAFEKYAGNTAAQVGGLQALALDGESASQTLQRAYAEWSGMRAAEIAIMRAQGKEAQALAAQRAMELLGLDDHNVALKRRIFALEDEAAAAQASTQSIKGLRDAIASITGAASSPASSIAARMAAFESNAAGALGSSGAARATYADALAKDLPDLASSLATVSATRGDWALATAKLAAQASAVADLMSGVKGYADGGVHPGGLRLVGERGMELEATGPSRIWTADQTRAFLATGSAQAGEPDARLVAQLQAVCDELVGLRYEARATASHTAKLSRLHSSWDGRGVLVRTDSDQPISTVVV